MRQPDVVSPGRLAPRDLVSALGPWRQSAPTLADALATTIRGAVVDGRLRVGGTLPSERELAGTLRVSRGTLVSALVALRRDGWVETRHGSGSRLQLPEQVTGRTTPWTLDHPGAGLELDLTHAVTAAPYGAVGAAARLAADAVAPLLLDDGTSAAPDRSLREILAARYTAEGLPTTPSQILLVAGARAALHLLLDELHEHGRPVVVENPTYHGALAIIRARTARLIPVPVVDGAWDLDALTPSARGTLAYLVPDFHNPTGALMSPAQRRALGLAADRLDLTLVVDETMRELDLRVPPEPVQRLVARNVVTVGTTSKTVWGGARLGWIRAAAPLVARLRRNPLAFAVSPAPLTQLTAIPLLAGLDGLLIPRRALLRRQRDHLATLLAGGDWDFAVPDGGLTIWLHLHARSARDVVERARRLGLALAPGTRFAADGGFTDRIRLPYTADEGVLARAVELLRQAT